MLYKSIFSFLVLCITLLKGDYNPQFIKQGGVWTDYEVCDNSQWAFDNLDPAVNGRHRDGGQDMITYCYRGEWSNTPAPYSNLFGVTQWNAFAVDGVTPLDTFELRIMFRVWGYCNFRTTDEIFAILRDDWQSTGANPDNPADDIWGRSREIFQTNKNRNNCDGWTGQLTSLAPDWLSEVSCTTGNNGVSCYTDFDETIEMENASRFGLRFQANVNNGYNSEAWAFSDIKLQINPGEVVDSQCCTGVRNDHPNKSCSAFHERRNCEAKGCHWAIHLDTCRLDCCRFDDKKDPNKVFHKADDECKELSKPPRLEECANREECIIAVCDNIGVENN